VILTPFCRYLTEDKSACFSGLAESLAFLWGIGPRVEKACVDHIKGFSYSASYEDLKLKPGR